MKAMGLLCKMLSLPDNWRFSEQGLASLFDKDGIRAVRSALHELQDLGYLHRYQVREGGKFAEWVWDVSDTPNLQNVSSVSPDLRFASSENASSQNDTQVITNREITKEHTPPTLSAEANVENLEASEKSAAKPPYASVDGEKQAWEEFKRAYPKPVPFREEKRARKAFADLFARRGMEYILGQIEAYTAWETKTNNRTERHWKNAAAWLLEGFGEKDYPVSAKAEKPKEQQRPMPEHIDCPICGTKSEYDGYGNLYWCPTCQTGVKAKLETAVSA